MSKSWWPDALVVSLGILILLCLLLPALQTTRHTGGRNHCLDNLRYVGLGLQNYHDTHKTFPAGAMHAGPRDNPRLGPSWWYGTLPFIEPSGFAPNIWETQRAGFEPAGVEFTYTSMPDTDRNPIKTWLRVGDRPFMRCPSSPSPERETDDGYIAFPSYVGITGGCDIDPNSIDYEGCPDVPQPSKVPGTLLFNVTTVRYLPNMKHVMSSDPEKCLPGCAEIMGLNNPLQSPHPGVVLVAFVDGSVHMISNTVDMSVLLQLAIRDDAMNVRLEE